MHEILEFRAHNALSSKWKLFSKCNTMLRILRLSSISEASNMMWISVSSNQPNFLTLRLHIGSFPSKWFGWFVGRLVLDPRSEWEQLPRSKLHFPPLICFLSAHAHLFTLSIVRSLLHKQAITQIVLFYNISKMKIYFGFKEVVFRKKTFYCQFILLSI